MQTAWATSELRLKVIRSLRFKVIRAMQTGWARPSGAMSHQPRAERLQRGSVTLGEESTPNGRPWRGQKPIPFAFLLLLLQSAIHAGRITQGVGSLRSPCPWAGGCSPVGANPARTDF